MACLTYLGQIRFELVCPWFWQTFSYGLGAVLTAGGFQLRYPEKKLPFFAELRCSSCHAILAVPLRL
jgi:hypothetical protein